MQEETFFLPLEGDEDVRAKYPELSRMEEFKNLAHAEMKFVWALECPATHIKKVEYKDRIKESFMWAFGNMSDSRFQPYCEGRFPEHIKNALNRMKSFDVPVRAKARGAVQKIFENLLKLSDVDVETAFIVQGEDGKKIGTDWTGRKQYISSSIEIAQQLPKIIQQVEEGFGIATKEGKVIREKGIDRFHSKKQ